MEDIWRTIYCFILTFCMEVYTHKGIRMTKRSQNDQNRIFWLINFNLIIVYLFSDLFKKVHYCFDRFLVVEVLNNSLW